MRKQFVSLLIATSLVWGVAGCGVSEPSADESRPASSVDEEEDRDRNIAGAIGAGILTTMVTNGLAMGLGAIPGMPKEITALFGGGGADNTAVLEAIAQVAEQIRQLDAKVDQVLANVQALDDKVASLAAAVQGLAEQQCASSKFAREAEIKEVMTLVNVTYDVLYAPSTGIATGVVTDIKNSNDATKTASVDDIGELKGQYDILKKNPKFDLVFDSLYDALLGGQNDQAGLVAHMMACTLQAKRFLTTGDTEQWRNYVEYFIVIAAKALQLTAFVEGFRAYLDNNDVSLDTLNRAAIGFERLSRGLLFMTQSQIPRGQILDSKTNKMWTAGGTQTSRLSVTRAVDAMNTCVSNGSQLENIARNPGASLDSNAVVRLKDCVTTTTLDSDGEAGQWRIPQIYELVKTGGQSGMATISWAPTSLFGLIDGWSDAKICAGGTSTCSSPSDYLTAAGAASLVNRYHEGLQYVWSNTSLAAARGPRDRATNAIMRENDKAMAGPNGFVNVTGYHYNGGWINGSNFMRHYQRSCREEFNISPVDVQQFNNCNADFSRDEMGPRCRAIMAGNPMPFSMASVQVANLGTQKPPVWGVSVANGNYGQHAGVYNTSAGKTSTFLAAKSFFNQYFACGTFHEDCDWTGSCDKWETKDFESVLPQYAQVVLVRDLFPGERYFFTDRGASPRSWVERARFEAPIVRVTLADGGRTRISALASQPSRTIDARCVVNPATPPKRFDELPATSNTCKVSGAFRLKPGPHTIYVMAKDKAVGGVESSMSVTQLSVGGQRPDPATGVTTTVGNQSVEFALASMSSDYDYYGEVVAIDQQARPLQCKIEVATKRCTIGQLVNNTRYSAKVITAFGVLTSDSAEEEVIPFGAPRAPVATVSKRGNGTIEFSIESPDSEAIKTPVTRFELSAEGATTVRCEAATQPTSCVLAGLDNDTVYDIVVKAVNGFGETLGAAPVAAQPLAPPGAPGGVSVAGADGVIKVFWERSTEGGSAEKYVATAINSATKAVAGTCQTLGEASASTVTVVPAATCNITKLDGETSYQVSVVAGNDGGESAATVAATAVTPRYAPGVPTVVASVRESRIFVSATVGQVGQSSGSTKSILVTSNVGNLSCTITVPATECEILGGSRDRNYTFRGVATNETGTSTQSQPSNAVLVYNPPSMPTIVSTDNGKSKITVVMERSLTEAVDGYVATAMPGGATCTAVVPSVSCDILGLTNKTPYTVTVRAFNNGGFSTPTAPTAAITPIPEPAKPGQPNAELGQGQAKITVRSSTDKTITHYVIKMVDDNATCEIRLPATSCVISGLETGFRYEFTATAYNKIGPSPESNPTEAVVPLSAPLPPTDAILTTSFADIVVEVLPDPESDPASKYSVKAEPGGYSCEASAATRKCVLRGAARGASYTISMTASNSGGQSTSVARVFYLTAPPSVPADVEVASSPTTLVVGFDASVMNADTKAVRVTATPGGKSCVITLPATTCGIDIDTSRSYVLQTVAINEVGEESTTPVRTNSTAFTIDVTESVIGDAAGSDATRTTDSKQASVSTAGNAAPVLKEAVSANPEALVSLVPSKEGDKSRKLASLFDSLSRTALKKQKVSKFSATVTTKSKKICRIDKRLLVVLSKGTCALKVSYTETTKKAKVKKSMAVRLEVD